jgi:hypothetical protein
MHHYQDKLLMPPGAQDLASAVAALFIAGMIWLRTRMHYTGRGRVRLELTRAGRIYFACVLVTLVAGWFCAPPLGRSLWPAAGSGIGADTTMTRVVWFLATYYLAVVIHRALHGRRVEVFTANEPL